MNLKQCCETLEIHENASQEEIRQAYRDLVTIWHPDQYQKNSRLQEKATEKLKALNTALDTLMALRQANRTNPVRHQGAPEKRTRQAAVPKKRKRSFSLWILLLASVAFTALALYLRWPFPLPGQARQGTVTDSGSSAHTLARARLDPEQVGGLQQALTRMGYDCGPADGTMGPKTIRAAQQFAIDFQLVRNGNFVESLLAESSRQASITQVHADWPANVNSKDFGHWIDHQNITSPDTCREVLSSGSAAQVINLIYFYIFDREKPASIKLPETGIVEKRFYRGMAPLTIKTRNESRHFFVKLLALPEQKEVLATFIRSGDMLKLSVPLGVYAVKYAVGATWYGTQWLFGSETVYSRIEKDIEFTFADNEITGYSIELYIEPTLLSKKAGDYAFDF